MSGSKDILLHWVHTVAGYSWHISKVREYSLKSTIWNDSCYSVIGCFI